MGIDLSGRAVCPGFGGLKAARKIFRLQECIGSCTIMNPLGACTSGSRALPLRRGTRGEKLPKKAEKQQLLAVRLYRFRDCNGLRRVGRRKVARLERGLNARRPWPA